MSTYREYPIRCKSCNEQIACHSLRFEELVLGGQSIEDALNLMGITDYCSRQAFMNPTMVTFNMENRQVIEGQKVVSAVKDINFEEPIDTMGGKPIFDTCSKVDITATKNITPIPINTEPTRLTNIGNLPTFQPPQTFQPGAFQPSQTFQPGTFQPSQTFQPGAFQPGAFQPSQTFQPGAFQPSQTFQPSTFQPSQTFQQINKAPLLNSMISQQVNRTPLPVLGAVIPRQMQKVVEDKPITPTIVRQSVKELGIDIEVKAEEGVRIELERSEEFKMPTLVGIPTININPLAEQQKVHVGAHKYVEILNSRAYLAR